MRGFAAIGLHRPKDPKNLGAIMRAAGCYGAAMVAVEGARLSLARTDTQKAHRHIPVIETSDALSVVPVGCRVIAVEFIPTARPLPTLKHPERAMYVFGPEDGSLPSTLLESCDDVVFIPTDYCLNLSMAVNTVLYDRMAKRGEWVSARPKAA
jgi:tRNA(Leu) C34 or U34 (ribose-2'-O)-methylase TrmL